MRKTLWTTKDVKGDRKINSCLCSASSGIEKLHLSLKRQKYVCDCLVYSDSMQL